MSEAYRRAGVDYRKLKIGKGRMSVLIPETRGFAYQRGIEVRRTGAWRLLFPRPCLFWGPIVESLGTKDYIAQWMYAETCDARHWRGIPADVVEMAVMDLLRHGALPFAGADLIAVWDGAWFEDDQRMEAVAGGFLDSCRQNGMALVGGETPGLRQLLDYRLRPDDAPVFAFAANGVIDQEFDAERDVAPGLQIVGVASSGPHANGYSLLKQTGLALADRFLTPVPGGASFGEEVLAPTRSYARLVEAVIVLGVPVAAFAPITGGGLGKLAAAAPFTYVIERWPERIPPVFPFLLERGISLKDCLSTFNWGIGACFIVWEKHVDRLLEVGRNAGYELYHLGHVENGEPRVIAQWAGGMVIEPPGD